MTQRKLIQQIVYESGEFEAVLNLAQRAAPSRATVLIQGESGTGKELVAHMLHSASQRAEGPFTVVNCAALPEALLESELFGYEKGAFTGADRDRKGLFEETNFGTLFIDEIGDLPQAAQVKLLRFLQDHRIYRVGGRQELQLDVRIVTATHRDLPEMVKSGSFREDLYYRLNVVSIKIPPLRYRRRDIRPLADHFFRQFAAKNAKQIRGLSPEAWQKVLRHDWPGNVRELENAIEYAVVVTTSDWIQEADLPADLLRNSTNSQLVAPTPTTVDDRQSQGLEAHSNPVDAQHIPIQPSSPTKSSSTEHTGIPADVLAFEGTFFEKIDQYERYLIRTALDESQGNRSEAARKLGISEKNIRDRLSKWQKS